MAPFPPDSDIADDPYEKFELQHADQLVAAAVPPKYWRAIYDKLTNEIFDAGSYFQILAEESEDGTHYSVVTLKDIDTENPESIFLIDHAWTFRPQIARQHLREIPGLLERVCAVFDIDLKGLLEDDTTSKSSETMEEAVKRLNASSSCSRLSAEGIPEFMGVVSSPLYGSLYKSREDCISEALERMWKYIQTYTIRYVKKEPQESDMPVWYMPDEFGVRIGHADKPNFRMLPMFYYPQQAAYSLLFPIRNVKSGETVTRDFIDSPIVRKNPGWRAILLHPWSPVDLTKEKLGLVAGTDEFFMDGRTLDILPEKEVRMPRSVLTCDTVKVYADDFQFIDRLKKIKVEKTDRIEEADVVWWRGHFHDFRGLAECNPNAFVNQFPSESVLTVKDLLAATVQSCYADGTMDERTMRWPPPWFETCFNLNNALPRFVAYYQQRELRGMDNTWIVKPWNLARGLDMHVTNNLSYIIRLVESGPKIACKYIHRPLLFLRPDNGNLVKFDLRYIILVTNLKPLKLVIYNKFWIRFAINEFSLHELDDRETHFTVFNYDYKSKVLQMKCEDFIAQLEKQYPTLKWNEIQQRINKVIREAVQAVSSGKSLLSIMPNPQSRAMYGVDIMLKWDSDDEKTRKLEISFIEANFMPDCERACDYYDTFADSAFAALFMGITDANEFTEL